MRSFRPDPSKVSAGIQIYEKGEYEMEIGEPKPFYRETKQGKNAGEWNHGVMFVCTITEGPEKGKKFIHNCMMHTPESEGFSKQFQMAAYGFAKKDEKQFDEEVAKVKDWGYAIPEDGTDPTCGDGWRDMKGRKVVFDLNKVKNKDNQDQQKVLGIRPA